MSAPQPNDYEHPYRPNTEPHRLRFDMSKLTPEAHTAPERRNCDECGDEMFPSQSVFELDKYKVHQRCFGKFSAKHCYRCNGTFETEPVDYRINDHVRGRFHEQCLSDMLAEKEKERLDFFRMQSEKFVASALKGLPSGWEHATMGTQKFKEFHPICQKFATNWRLSDGSALVLGLTGCGKTSGVVAALRRNGAELLAQEIEASAKGATEHSDAIRWFNICWTDGFELINSRRQHSLGDGETALVNRAKGAPILVIDELGFESREADPVFLEIVDHRYKLSNPTLVTSGATLPEFQQRYGAAFVRRLCEQGRGKLVDCHPKAKASK